MAVLHIAVDVAVVVVVGPDRSGEAADRGADRGALDHADAGHDRADRGTAESADRRVLGDPRIARAARQRDRTCRREGQNGFLHRLSPVLLSLPGHAPGSPGPPATVHVTSAGTTIKHHRSAGATMLVGKARQYWLTSCLTD